MTDSNKGIAVINEAEQKPGNKQAPGLNDERP